LCSVRVLRRPAATSPFTSLRTTSRHTPPDGALTEQHFPLSASRSNVEFKLRNMSFETIS
jgi:hypothetical protein